MTHINTKRSTWILGTYNVLRTYPRFYKSSSRTNPKQSTSLLWQMHASSSFNPIPQEWVAAFWRWLWAPRVPQCWLWASWRHQLGVPIRVLCCQAQAEPLGHGAASGRVTTTLLLLWSPVLLPVQICISLALLFSWLLVLFCSALFSKFFW